MVLVCASSYMCIILAEVYRKSVAKYFLLLIKNQFHYKAMAPAKKNQLSTENALASVQVYMQQQYRPYSVSDILLNMHNVLTKPKLITILDTLVADQQLVCKTIGKASYYVYKNKSAFR